MANLTLGRSGECIVVGDDQLKSGQNDVYPAAKIVDPMKAALRAGRFGGDVVTVVRKLFAGGQARGFADDFVALDDLLAAVGMRDYPFAPE